MLPHPILDYIIACHTENRSPAYLLISSDGILLDCGGSLSVYGLSDLQKGESVGERIYFLEGLLPLIDSPLVLRFIKMESGKSADIHIFSGNGGDWALFLDSTQEEIRDILIQQKVNDLSLLRDRHSKLLNSYLGADQAEHLAREAINFQPGGERKEITVLFADIQGFTADSEKISPETVYKKLNLYLSAIIQPILDEAGVIDKIMGDTVMAVFGLLHSQTASAKQAVRAAFRIMEAVRELNRALQSDNQTALDLGAGIASGTATLGIVGSKDRRSLSVIGRPVNLASRLQNQTRPNEILIDECSFKQIDLFQSHFSAAAPLPNGNLESVNIFSSIFKNE